MAAILAAGDHELNFPLSGFYITVSRFKELDLCLPVAQFLREVDCWITFDQCSASAPGSEPERSILKSSSSCDSGKILQELMMLGLQAQKEGWDDFGLDVEIEQWLQGLSERRSFIRRRSRYGIEVDRSEQW